MDISGIGQVQSIQAGFHAPPPVVQGQAPVVAPLLNPAVPELAKVRGPEKLRERQRGEPSSSLKIELDREWTPDANPVPKHPGEDGQRPEDRPPHVDILA
ncbi:MAG: hypothetical protein AB7F75_10120 [Planctomycetota bacterium]